MGSHVFIGERVVIAQWDEPGASGVAEFNQGGKAVVELGNYMQLNRETAIELSGGGSVSIGAQVGIQMRCFLQAAFCPIKIGNRAMVAPYCVFLTGEPRARNTEPIDGNGWDIRGPIVVEDDAWLGVGVKVLGGVTIGEGAVVAAGSVVTSDIPAGAVAAGNPARLIRRRADLTSDIGKSTEDGVSKVR
jgi:acetyltransferase-like isoleucine patch superfamily enzyme